MKLNDSATWQPAICIIPLPAAVGADVLHIEALFPAPRAMASFDALAIPHLDILAERLVNSPALTFPTVSWIRLLKLDLIHSAFPMVGSAQDTSALLDLTGTEQSRVRHP